MEERIKNMTFKDILDVMIKGLEKKWVNINMDTYGDVDLNGICYGCAATNALCEMIQKPFPAEFIKKHIRHHYLKVSGSCLDHFERAVDLLRRGLLRDYGFHCLNSDFLFNARPQNLDYYLPCLNDDFTEDQLDKYKKLRDSL